MLKQMLDEKFKMHVFTLLSLSLVYFNLSKRYNTIYKQRQK